MALTYSSADGSNIDGAGSSQVNTFFWLKKALIEARKEQFFMPLASVQNMPKHMGKTIKVYEYVPLLDDRNINDQGLDAAGAVLDEGNWTLRFPLVMQIANANAAAAEAAIEASDISVDVGADDSGEGGAGTGFATLTLDTAEGTFTAAQKATVLALALKLNVAAGTSAIGYIGAIQHSGNLYGSSKDVGLITSKLPALTENGGRVNRVGFTRLQREGSISKFGFFHEFTKESIDFDSDDELKDHLARELMNGAVQMTEAALQMDLLAAADVVVYPGAAVSDATVSGVSDDGVVAYADFQRLDQLLTDNRTPRQTKVITGSRLVDTKVIPSCRVAFCGSEVVPLLQEMTDQFSNKAFIEVQHYADAGTVLNGEIGSIGAFRIVQVPEMLHWAGVGATEGVNPGYRVTADKYNVYPILVVGDDSFTTIGFQTDGKSVKFDVITKMPGAETADRDDPYGEKGFSSIKWYYGILVKRPERIGLLKTVAPV